MLFGGAALGVSLYNSGIMKTPQKKKTPQKCVRIDDSVEVGLIPLEDLLGQGHIDKALDDGRKFLDSSVLEDSDKSVLHMLRSTLKNSELVLKSCKAALSVKQHETKTNNCDSSTNERILTLESELRLFASRENTLTKLAQTSKTELTTMESEIRLLRSSMACLEKSRDRAVDDAKTFQASFYKIEEKYLQREKELERSNSGCTMASHEITRLQSDVETTRDELSSTVQLNARLRGEIRAKDESLSLQNTEFDHLKLLLREMNDERNLINRELSLSKECGESLVMELEALRRSLLDTQSDLQKALNDLSSKHSVVSESEQIALLKTDLESLEREKQQLIDRYAQAETSLQLNQSKQNDEARLEIDQQVLALQLHLDDEMKKSQEKSTELDLLHEKISAMLISQDEISYSEEALVAHASSMNQVLTDTHSELETMRVENAELSDKLQTSLNEAIVLRQRNESLSLIKEELTLCEKKLKELEKNTANLLNEEFSKMENLEAAYDELQKTFASFSESSTQTKTALNTSEANLVECRVQLNEKCKELAAILLHCARCQDKICDLETDLQYKSKLMELDAVDIARLKEELNSQNERHLADVEDLKSQVVLFKQEGEMNRSNAAPATDESEQYELMRCQAEVSEAKRLIQDLRHQLITRPNSDSSANASVESLEISRLVIENSSLKELVNSRDADLQKAKEILEIGGNSIAHLRGELGKLKKHYKFVKNEKTASVMKISSLEAELAELRRSTSTLHHDNSKEKTTPFSFQKAGLLGVRDENINPGQQQPANSSFDAASWW